MLISEIYNTIVNFLKLVIDDDNVKVFDANQNESRPKKPFVTVDLSSFQQAGRESNYSVNGFGVQEVLIMRKFTVKLQAFADRLHQSEDILNTIENALRTQLAFDQFTGKIAYNKTLTGITPLPAFVSSGVESRAMLDLEFYAAQVVQSNSGFIDRIEIHDNLTNDDIIITT